MAKRPLSSVETLVEIVPATASPSGAPSSETRARASALSGRAVDDDAVDAAAARERERDLGGGGRRGDLDGGLGRGRVAVRERGDEDGGLSQAAELEPSLGVEQRAGDLVAALEAALSLGGDDGEGGRHLPVGGAHPSAEDAAGRELEAQVARPRQDSVAQRRRELGRRRRYAMGAGVGDCEREAAVGGGERGGLGVELTGAAGAHPRTRDGAAAVDDDARDRRRRGCPAVGGEANDEAVRDACGEIEGGAADSERRVPRLEESAVGR